MEYSREEELVEPASPVGQSFNSTFLCMDILVVLEFDVPIHDLQFVSFFKNAFISIPRLSSIMVCDEKGMKRWKRVEVKWEEHFIEPKFIDGMSLDTYDKQFSEYLTKLAMEKLPALKPLWEIHVIKYPTNKAAATLVLKFNHAIGDGYTLMGLLLSNLKRAQNPSLPLSFPSRKPSNKPTHNKLFSLMRMSKFFSKSFNSISLFGWRYLRRVFYEDVKTPIKSGHEGIDSRPTKISNVTFSIQHIKEIKSKLGVSINDVITGIIFYGVRLYMQDVDIRSKTLETTALVIANTRNIEDYRGVNDMLKTNSHDQKGIWGNNVMQLHLSIPKLKDTQISNPLQFVMKAHTSIKKKRNSFEALLTSMFVLLKNKFQGHEAIAKLVHMTFKNSSLAISNMIGPLEQMALANHPIRGFFFTVSGVPQSLVFTIMSYMGMLRVTILSEEGFIEEQRLVWNLNIAYEIICHEALKLNITPEEK